MNTNNFDLNIKNYQPEELKNMFDLPDNYDEQMIDTMELRFKNGILSNKKVSDETKAKTLYFLTEAKKVLREQIMNFEGSLKSVLKATSNYTLIPTPLDSNGEHMVQSRDKKPYFRSLPREYFEGVINPIVRTTIHQNLNIDTRFRDNYYGSSSSNFAINIPLVLSNMLNMQLVAIELPTTFFTISKQLGNNFFTLSITTSISASRSSASTICSSNSSVRSCASSGVAISSSFRNASFSSLPPVAARLSCPRLSRRLP